MEGLHVQLISFPIFQWLIRTICLFHGRNWESIATGVMPKKGKQKQGYRDHNTPSKARIELQSPESSRSRSQESNASTPTPRRSPRSRQPPLGFFDEPTPPSVRR
eukprot:EG_transcript_62328